MVVRVYVRVYEHRHRQNGREMDTEKEAYEAAKAARAEAAVKLAEKAAHGLAVHRDDPLAVAYRDAATNVVVALRAWCDAHQARTQLLLAAN